MVLKAASVYMEKASKTPPGPQTQKGIQFEVASLTPFGSFGQFEKDSLCALIVRFNLAGRPIPLIYKKLHQTSFLGNDS